MTVTALKTVTTRLRLVVLLAEAMMVLAAAAFTVAFVPFRRTAAFACRTPTRACAVEAERTRRIGAVRWAVSAGARRAPWRAMCFEKGLAAQWMLRRRGVAATLHYGIAKRPDGLAAHVWVLAGETEVVGCEIRDQYAELARFPADDR